jgi:hypothetical protein
MSKSKDTSSLCGDILKAKFDFESLKDSLKVTSNFRHLVY